MNKLLRAVEDYLDDEREYVRFAEKEIQVLEQKARDERRQTQRRMIAALYWRAGDAEVIGRAYHHAGGRGSMVTARSWLEASSALAHAARVMEAACPR